MSQLKGRYRIYIAKERSKFSAAHMTIFPDGKKEGIHGHNFTVKLSLDLMTFDAEQFIDFRAIKDAVDAQCLQWDEKLLLPTASRHFLLISETSTEIEFILCEKRYVIPRDEVVKLSVSNVIVETLAELFSKALLPVIELMNSKSVILGYEVEISECPGQGAQFFTSF